MKDVSSLAIYEYKNGRLADIYLEYMSSAEVKEIAVEKMSKGKPIKDFLEWVDSESLKAIMRDMM